MNPVESEGSLKVKGGIRGGDQSDLVRFALAGGMDDGGRGVGGPLGAGKVRKQVLPRPSGKEYSCTDTLTEAVRPCQTSD